MKAIVLKKFRDKTTKSIRKVGEVFEATKERVEELIKVGNYVEEFNLDAMKKAELVTIAKQFKVPGYSKMDVEGLRQAVKELYKETR